MESETENIAVGTHASGVVKAVHVRVNDRVAAGAPLFELDDRHLAAELTVREATRDGAAAQLARLEALPRKEEVPPLEARVAEAKANLDEKEKLFERARSQMENVVELGRPIEVYLARCYGHLENPTQQFEAYRRLAKLDPESVTAALGMAQAAQELGQYSEALEYYRKASKMGKAPATASVELARLMIHQARSQGRAARWQDVEGKTYEEEIDGLLAVCLQHEMDHLNGVLFIDHLSRLKRDMVLKKLAKWRKEQQKKAA